MRKPLPVPVAATESTSTAKHRGVAASCRTPQCRHSPCSLHWVCREQWPSLQVLSVRQLPPPRFVHDLLITFGAFVVGTASNVLSHRLNQWSDRRRAAPHRGRHRKART
ncbi:hypothetical protein GCM10009839_17610 [Catenulispora yoronensis]|uniref:Uncharacterized protein n=1 Tax=Catenulispora yoronensis TaxID=450799 RepID=A0ABN2TVP8_9ACTN